jgi:hypothetical protein
MLPDEEEVPAMMRFVCPPIALLVLGWAVRGDDVRPNVVFLLADDLGREDRSFMGGRRRTC